MKKYLLMIIGGALAVSCSENEFMNEEAIETSDGILFHAENSAVTRGAQTVGEKAANRLNKHFVVYGTKHTSAEDGTATNDKVVFNHYNVEWVANTAGTALSNTSNWDYVGRTSYSDFGSGVVQGIKYWDYSAAGGYTFYAFSSKDLSYPAKSTDLVSIAKVTADPATGTKSKYNKGYTVNIKSGASLDDILYSDRAEISKSQYGSVVTFNFHSFGTKVRVGFYETVPGYKVKITKFYYDSDATSAVNDFANMTDASTTNFTAAMQNVNMKKNSVLTITYYDETTGSTNRPKLTNTTAEYNYSLTLGSNLINKELGTSATTAVFDTDGTNQYTGVYPFEANANPMLIKLDYTLEAEDGQGETIEIKNARVVVPTQYVQWRGNYCYTYLFKISDKTNGNSGTPGTDPEGLYPVTFDAVSEASDASAQETVTTVTPNSVTSYAADGYKKSKDIYAVTSKVSDGSVIAPSAIGTEAKNAQVYTVTGSGISEATVLASLNGAKNGLSLSALTGSNAATLVYQVPASDGSKYTFGTLAAPAAVKFTPGAAGTYAYVYCTTKYVAPTYQSVASDAYSSATQYYFKTSDNVYYAASGITKDNYETNKANLYKKTDAGTAGVYDVKVITITE